MPRSTSGGQTSRVILSEAKNLVFIVRSPQGHGTPCPYTIFRYRSDVRISAKSYDAIINDVEETDTNPEDNPEDE